MLLARDCAILGFGLMLAAASTEARELQFSVESRISGDSNVLRTSSDRRADGIYSLSPEVILRENHSKLNYRFSYRPTYETFFTTSGIDGFDHRAQGVLSWRPTGIGTFDLNGNFSNRRNLRLEDENAGTGSPSFVENDRTRVQRFDAQLSYNRAISEAFSVQASATIDDVDYSRGTDVDSRAYSGTLGLQYTMNPTTAVGLSASIRERQSRPGGGSQFESDTEIWNVAFSLQRVLTPNLSFSAQAGPSFLSTKQTVPPSSTLQNENSSSTSFFALLAIDRAWQRSDFRASYVRSESSGGNNAVSSINDNISLDFHYRIDRQSTFRILAKWLRSEEISSVPGPGGEKLETTQYSGFASLNRRITRRWTVVGQLSFISQDQNDTPRSNAIGEVYSGYLSIRYTFDPIVF